MGATGDEVVRVECPTCTTRQDTDMDDETYCWNCGRTFPTTPHTISDLPSAPTGDLFLVLTSYDDPHPHVEGVFTDRDDAEDLMDECRAVTGDTNPNAWTLVRVNEHGHEVLSPSLSGA